MKSDRWNLIEEIFQGALERPSDARMQYAEEACGNDNQLLVEVQSLLESDRDAEVVLHAAIAEDLRALAKTSSPSEIGLRLGPYLLVRELDGGGMGVVYLAVRSDDHYFQIVAIKMVRKGLDSPDLVQRFRMERQILATLSHPNIGAILDGGETEDGRPFIVMEFVEGQPITLASHGSSIRERVELFRSVCSAVHYAHQKLILHRDIKPSNVMVTPDGVVKLIDFGISKPMEPQLVLSETTTTEPSSRMMTPDYASPEQIQGRELTTATDIYSLGVLLYEILAGSRPYTLRNLSPAAAERVVCEQNPRKPSSAADLCKRMRREISGDLDRIVLTAMHVDPFERYQSVQHLDEDLLRYLQGKPIAAKKSSLVYLVRKFVQRHKEGAVLGACALLLVPSVSFLVYSRQSHIAERRAKQVRALADSAISDMTDKLQHSSASTETQAAIFHSALRFLDGLRKSSGDDPRLLLELSRAYVRVGDLEGSPLVADLGNSDTAVTSYREASRVAIEANARMPGTETTEAVIETYQRLGSIEQFLGNLSEAKKDYKQALSRAQELWRQDPNDPARIRLLALNLAGLGDVNLWTLSPVEALDQYHAAFRIFGDHPDGADDHDEMLIGLYLKRASALNEIGNQVEALANNHQAVALAEALVQRYPSSVKARRELFLSYEDIVLPLAGRNALNVGDSEQAQVYARKGLSIAQTLAGIDKKNAQALYDLTLAYTSIGDSYRLTRPAQAGRWYRKSLDLTENLAPLYGEGARHWIAIRNEALAEVLRGQDQAPERLRLLLEANLIRRELGEASPHGRLHLMRSYCKLSDAELDMKNVAKAQQYASAALPLLVGFQVTSPSLLVLRDVGFCEESEAEVHQRIALDPAMPPAERGNAATVSREWYQKSLETWTTWNKRGAATPESEHERHKVEHLLALAGSSPAAPDGGRHNFNHQP
jgi:serine/threonine protein kinase/tetratricopeptide (TPR) repeat protein